MTKVADVLRGKGGAIYGIGSEDPVLEAVRVMAERHVGALVVLDGTELKGIVSERDYARKVVLLGRSSAETPVWQIMSAPVITVTREDTVQHCLEIMTERRIRHLPVVDGQTVVGVLSIGDLVKVVIDTQRRQIADLERFIHS